MPHFCKNCKSILHLSVPTGRFDDLCSAEKRLDWVTGTEYYEKCRKVRCGDICENYEEEE